MSTQSETDLCQQMGATCPEHEKLNAFVGTWNATVSFWMDPTSEPMIIQGFMTNSWTLGNRFLEQDYKATWGDQPFLGRGFWGYNTLKGEFEGIWMDTASTQISFESGSHDPETNSWTQTGTCTMPDGSTIKKESVITIVNENQHTMTMTFINPDGSRFKCMHIDYTRS